MLDVYYFHPPAMDDPPSTEAQREAVGKLMYHCGVALEMDYGPSGSSSYLIDIPPALMTYFRYCSAEIRE